MTNAKTFAWLNTVAFIMVIVVNTLANALPINGLNTGEVSNLYPSLFTPAGFTFSIWSVIYLLLAGFIVYQWKILSRGFFPTLSKWFIASCILNAAWIFVWHNLLTGLSVVVMLLFLFVLIRIFWILKSENSKTLTEYILLHLPFTLYFSWICVATIANISAWLISISWDGDPLSETAWTIIMMIVAALLGAFILTRFHNYAFPLVTMWALVGIAIKGLPAITPVAIVLIGVLVFLEVVVVIRKKGITTAS